MNETQPIRTRRRSFWKLVGKCFSEVQENKTDCPQKTSETSGNVEADERIRQWLNQSRKILPEKLIPQLTEAQSPRNIQTISSKENHKSDKASKQRTKNEESLDKSPVPTEKSFSTGVDFFSTFLADMLSTVGRQTNPTDPLPTAENPTANDSAFHAGLSVHAPPWFNLGPIFYSQSKK